MFRCRYTAGSGENADSRQKWGGQCSAERSSPMAGWLLVKSGWMLRGPSGTASKS